MVLQKNTENIIDAMREALRKITKRTLKLRIRKRPVKFLGNIMRKNLENLTLMGHIEGKRVRSKLSSLPNKLV